MGARTGNCAECGTEFAQINARRKYCAGCQILRDTSMYDIKRDCEVCTRTFYPVRSNYRMCADCLDPRDRPDKYPICKGCGRHRRPAPMIESHCISCVQSTKELRAKYLILLRRRINALKVALHNNPLED